MEASVSGSTPYLAIPQSLTRALSQESFASNLSIRSLSSLLSESVAAGARRHRTVCVLFRTVSWVDPEQDDDDETEDSPEIIKYREAILERMLESNTLVFPSESNAVHGGAAGGRRQPPDADRRRGEAPPSMVSQRTASDDRLLAACASTSRPRRLFKSFSTNDIFTFVDMDHDVDDGLKHCVSQAWLPSGYVLMLRGRRRSQHQVSERCNYVDTAAARTPECPSNAQTTPVGNDDGCKSPFGVTSTADFGCATPDSSFKLERVLSDTLSGGGVSRRTIDYHGGDVNAQTAGALGVGGGGVETKTTSAGVGGSAEDLTSLGGGRRQRRAAPAQQSAALQFVARRLCLSKAIGRRLRRDLIGKLATKTTTSSSTNSAAAAPGLSSEVEQSDVDVDRDKGRPVTRRERNFVIFHWLQSFDESGDP